MRTARRWGTTGLTAAALLTSSCTLSAIAAGDAGLQKAWTIPAAVRGPVVAAVLDDGTSVLVSAGGERGKVLFEQRRATDGTLSDRVPIGPVERGTHCDPLLSDAQGSTVAVAVRCQTPTGLEDPPSITVELVWTEATGWTSEDRRRSEPISVDVSPNGEHAVFTTDNEWFGRPTHVSSYDVGVGWTDRTWAERGVWGDTLNAAVDDSGQVEVVRSTGFEDEPGYWIGGAVELMHYDDATDTWVRDFLRKGGGIGVTQFDIDAASDGTLFGSYIRHYGNKAELWVLRAATPDDPQLVQAGKRSAGVYSQASAVAAGGTGHVVWQQHAGEKAYTTSWKRWRADGSQLRGGRISGRLSPTFTIRYGAGVALAIAGNQLTLVFSNHEEDSPTTDLILLQGRVGAPEYVATTFAQPRRVAVQAGQGATGDAALAMNRWRYYSYFLHRSSVAFFDPTADAMTAGWTPFAAHTASR